MLRPIVVVRPPPPPSKGPPPQPPQPPKVVQQQQRPIVVVSRPPPPSLQQQQKQPVPPPPQAQQQQQQKPKPVPAVVVVGARQPPPPPPPPPRPIVVVARQPQKPSSAAVVVQQQQQKQQPKPPQQATAAPIVVAARPQPQKPAAAVVVVAPPLLQQQRQSSQKQKAPASPVKRSQQQPPPPSAVLLSSPKRPRSAGAAMVPLRHQQQQQQTAPLLPAVASLSAGMVELSLVAQDAFVATSAPSPVVESIFREAGGRVDERSAAWTFPLSAYRNVIADLSSVPSVQVAPLPAQVEAVFVDGRQPGGRPLLSAEAVDAQLVHVPAKLAEALFPFQRDGVRFALQHGGRCMIADEMGLGKTLQALAVATAFRMEWPFLVVVPSSLRLQWAEKIEEWLGLYGRDINVVQNGKGQVADGVAVIISYDLLHKFEGQLQARRFQVVIADESHMLKNRLTKRTKTVLPIIKNARRALLLTGTPALSRPVELYSQIDAVDHSVAPNFRNFTMRYCEGFQGNWGWEASGAKNLTELNLLLQGTVMIRRLKRDVLGELPLKRRERINIGIVKQHTKIIQTVMSDLRTAIRDVRSGSAEVSRNARSESQRLVMELYRDSGAAKLPLVTSYIRDVLESSTKFLVFAHHQDVMDGIEHTLKSAGAGYIRIDGKTPSQQRFTLVQHFQEDPDCRVALLSITAAGVGLNLTAASLIVFAELFWNPGALRQAEDRAHRIGQTSDVTVRYLVAKNTVDEMIWNLIEKKLDILGQALDGHEEHQEIATFEGRQDASSCVDQFLHDILEVVDTYDQRKEAYQASRAEKRRGATKRGRDCAATGEGDESSRGADSDGQPRQRRKSADDDVEFGQQQGDDDDEDEDSDPEVVAAVSAAARAPKPIIVDISSSQEFSGGGGGCGGSPSKYDRFLCP